MENYLTDKWQLDNLKERKVNGFDLQWVLVKDVKDQKNQFRLIEEINFQRDFTRYAETKKTIQFSLYQNEDASTKHMSDWVHGWGHVIFQWAQQYLGYE